MSPRPEISVRPDARPGFALICVLALVCLAALSTTAFLANSRIERLSARTIGDQTRLDLALTFGANLTLGQMSKMDTAWNWITFLRGEDSNGVGYLFAGTPYTGSIVANLQQWTCFPLFSPANITTIDATNPIPANALKYTLSNQASFVDTRTNMGINPATNFLGGTIRIPLLGSRTSPPVGWITNKTLNVRGVSVPIFRFAYFTEDVEGLFQADRMGGTTNRTTGTNPEEISLLAMGASNSAIPTFINNRKAYLTPGMIATVFSNEVSLQSLFTNAAFFGVGTRAMNGNSPDVSTQQRAKHHVPLGLGYAGGNSNLLITNKLNLNDYLAPANSANNVRTIAGWIGTNLPNFAATRAGGFIIQGGGATNADAHTTNAYLQTLAASMIDYADADSTPTTDGAILSANRERPVYRGVDSCPWVNEYVTRFNLLKTNPATKDGIDGIAILIETTDYIEVWNPSSQSCTGTLNFVAINRQPLTVGFSANNFANPWWATNANGQAVGGGVSSSSILIPADKPLAPNAFRVFACTAVTNCFFYPGNNLSLPLTMSDDIQSSYRVAWNGVYYDGGLGGLRRQSKTLTAINSPKWSGTCPGFVGENLAGAYWNMSGDPRATIYQSMPQSSVTYDKGSSFGGRNFRSNVALEAYGQVMPSRWPDGGNNSQPGIAAGSDLPTSVQPAPYTNCPPSRISNSGVYSNVCELGNIFDPIQWFDQAGVSTNKGYGSDGGQWANLTPSAVSNNAYGGGTSLRIGRAELGKFAWTNVTVSGITVPMPNMQASAAALLDLFCVTNNYDDGGKINLNTAPPVVLRALAYGVTLTKDGSAKSIPVPLSAVDAFVKGVTNFRAKYPFLSPSQLTFIWTNNGFPNTNSWPTNGAVFGDKNLLGVSQWDDEAAEEWFGKIYGLSKVESRNWRVYCVAQLLNTNGSPVGGIVRRYYELTARQNNDNPPTVSGFISGQAPY